MDDLVAASSGSKGQGATTVATGSSSESKDIMVSQEGAALTITLNRPKKYNALNYQVRNVSIVKI